jgi:hypothetical protein
MLRSTLAVVALGCTGCSNVVDSLKDKFSDLGNKEPLTGFYSTTDDVIYHVNTKGPAALTITQKETNLCLLFWKSKNPVDKDGLVKLRGQTCSNGKFGDLDWSAMYSYNRENVFILYPPGTFVRSDVKPIEIYYSKLP